MSQQLSIDFAAVPAPYQKHSRTSRLAALSIAPAAGSQRALVLEEIRIAGERGRTDCEIQAMTMLSGDTVRPRRGELLKAGLIADSGRTRKTPNGREAVVWVAKGYAT